MGGGMETLGGHMGTPEGIWVHLGGIWDPKGDIGSFKGDMGTPKGIWGLLGGIWEPLKGYGVF